jgi:glycosyltransferase involved in cell wall biosynthesis
VRDLDVASGGPSRSVPALAESQARSSAVEVTVAYQDRGNRVVPLASSNVAYRALHSSAPWGGAELFAEGQGATQNASTIFHLHGLWSPLLHRSARFAVRQNIPYVVSTRGMLANWALGHKSLKKKLAWRLYQRTDLNSARCIVASSQYERQDVLALLPDSRVVAIPNGCRERPGGNPGVPAPILEQGVRWALAVGRLHPVKGYSELIEAWASLQPAGWKLAIAGPDEAGYRSTLEDLIARHGLSECVVLLGEVDDAGKWSLYDQCELFVAPSKTENFGMAIAEALQSGAPVITTTGTPWHELQGYNCGWWIEPDASSLHRALKAATSLDAQTLNEMGSRGHRLIAEKYAWDQVAARTIELYCSILEGDLRKP